MASAAPERDGSDAAALRTSLQSPRPRHYDSDVTRYFVSSLLPLALATSVAFGQDAPVAAAPDATAYQGVTPESGSPPAEARVRRAHSRLVTWPGFEAMPNGGSRFFLQLSQTVQFQTRATDGGFEVTLQNTRTHLRNTTRPLETRFFDTPVTRARVERRGCHDLVFAFDLRAQATPRVYTQPGPGGYTFLFVEFPAGNWLPAELQPAAPQAPAAAQPRGPVQQQTDRERPPDLGQSEN